jgi:chromosome segregation ATPase
LGKAGNQEDVMDFSKFDLLETKVSALIERLAEAETAKTGLSGKLSAAEEASAELAGKLSAAEDALAKAEADLGKLRCDNDALAEIQESAKAKIEDLLKDRQSALARVETLLEKLGSWS